MIVVVGYASIDRAVRVDRLPAPGATARVLGDVGDGLRPGGIAHAAMALVAATDDDVAPVCAVGDDAAGRAYTGALAEAGCRADGIAALAGRSPTAQLLYEPGGGTCCLFDPGVPWDELTEPQRGLIGAADVVVVMIGPANVIRATLAHSPDEATVAWIVKNDPAALVPDVVTALSERADLIFHNVAEASVVAGLPTGPDQVVVRTDGGRPVTVMSGGERRSYPIPASTAVRNPTGAGDAFAGGFLASWRGSGDESSNVAAGAAAARRRVEADQ